MTRGDLELGSDSDLVKDSRVREELVYIYIYREREREREKDASYTCWYIYYICWGGAGVTVT